MVLQQWETVQLLPREEDLSPDHLYVMFCTVFYKQSEDSVADESIHGHGWNTVIKHGVVRVNREVEEQSLKLETLVQIVSSKGFREAQTISSSLYGKIPSTTDGMLILAIKAKQHCETNQVDALPIWDVVYECRPPFKSTGTLDPAVLCSICDFFLFPTSANFPVNHCSDHNHPHHAECFAYYALEQEDTPPCPLCGDTVLF